MDDMRAYVACSTSDLKDVRWKPRRRAGLTNTMGFDILVRLTWTAIVEFIPERTEIREDWSVCNPCY